MPKIPEHLRRVGVGLDGRSGRNHHMWAGGIRFISNVDDLLTDPRVIIADVISWIYKKSKLDPLTGCINWEAQLDSDGYGQVNLKGTITYAHRISYITHNLAPLNKMHVLHTCDNPGCVNPSHLKIGTHTDNMRDASNKGRFKSRPRRFGVKSANYKHGKYCK